MKKSTWMSPRINFFVGCFFTIFGTVFSENADKAVLMPFDDAEEESIWKSVPDEVDKVNVQILDKSCGKVFHEVLRLNEPFSFRTIKLTLKKAFSDQKDRREVYAYIEIQEKGKVIFLKWLFASSPSKNIFEHQLYDVRVEFPESACK
ncbi:MAG: DUF2155 domain-containing protein [Alphaproteobacteria bacterium]|nr:DUF2155 domain-containing protein [Alphaproteobacteria bacterium]